jgi:hypothetical protein
VAAAGGPIGSAALRILFTAAPAGVNFITAFAESGSAGLAFLFTLGRFYSKGVCELHE